MESSPKSGGEAVESLEQKSCHHIPLDNGNSDIAIDLAMKFPSNFSGEAAENMEQQSLHPIPLDNGNSDSAADLVMESSSKSGGEAVENLEQKSCHLIPFDNGNSDFAIDLAMKFPSNFSVEAAENMEQQSLHPIPLDNGNSEVTRSLRDVPPAHYIFKIESFSQLSQILFDSKVQNYESDIFEASGYKWKLSIYPNGDKERNEKEHISLYLVIAETDNLPSGWEVKVSIKLFVYNQIQDKYMTIQDANEKIRRFHGLKTEWGFTQLLPLTIFNDPSNGYLIRDTCMFGAEVFVMNYTGRGECLSLLKEELDSTYTWKIDKFSALDCAFHHSDVFTVGNCKWKLRLNPKGYSEEKGKFLSLFLELDNRKTFPSERKIYAKFILCIRNQSHGQNQEIIGSNWFNTADSAYGYPAFMLLTDLHDASKGFLVNDTLIVQCKITVMSTVKNFTQ